MIRKLYELGVAELLNGYATRSFTPVDVLEALFSRIEQTDVGVKAVVAVRREQALKEAAQSVLRWRVGTALGLDGIPVGIKDMIDVSGMTTTAGSTSFAWNIARRDAESVRRLRAAGAIVTAKLATSPFAFADPFAEGSTPTRNPWDQRRYAGGTSSGPAAALAAGMVPLALGTDSAGSSRIPASHTGVTGFKPTHGAISRFGVVPSTKSLDTVGVMARSASDIATALAVLAGRDRRDPAARIDIEVDAGIPISGLRVGVLRGAFTKLCTPAAEASYDAALRILMGIGCELRQFELPMIELVEPISWPILGAELASVHEALVDTPVNYGRALSEFLEYGRSIPATDYIRCLKMRVVFLRELRRALEAVDVIVSPTTQAVAPLLDTLVSPTRAGDVPWFDFAAKNTLPFSLAGMPAVSVPIAPADLELPFGLQIAGRPRCDGAVLHLAAQFQRACEFHQVLPGPATSS